MVTEISWPPSNGSGVIQLISEQHVNTSGSSHTYASISGVQAGDLMVMFTGGSYRVTAITGWTLIADAGAGGLAMASSVLSRVATSSSESVTAAFGTANAGNFSSIVVLRRVQILQLFSTQTYNAVQNTTPLNFPGGVAMAVNASAGRTISLMFVHGATAGVTFTPSPAAVETIFSLTSAGGGRNFHLFRLPVSGAYTATASASEYKAGSVVHVG